MPDARKKAKAKKGKSKEALTNPLRAEDIGDASAVSATAEIRRDEPPLASELRTALWSGQNSFSFADLSQVDRWMHRGAEFL